MRTSLSSLGVFCLMALVGAAASARQADRNAQERPSGPKRSVAVFSFEIKVNPSGSDSFSLGGAFGDSYGSAATSIGTISIPDPSEFGSGLADMMITGLTESKSFVVIDLPRPREAVDLGGPPETELPPVRPQYWLKASVTEVSCRRKSGGINIGGVGGGQGSYENVVTLDVRLVDPVTHEVIESVKSTGKKTAKSSIFSASKYAGGSIWHPATKVLDLTFADFQSCPLAEAARLAIADAVKKLGERAAKRPWEATVVHVSRDGGNTEIYLNVRSDCGLVVSQILELSVQGDKILDPETGLVIGRTRPKFVGRIAVSRLDADIVICKPVESLAQNTDLVQPGLIVRLPQG